jgi:hypothetical protein
MHVVWWLWIGLTGLREREVLPDPSLLCREAEWTGSGGERGRYVWTGRLYAVVWAGCPARLLLNHAVQFMHCSQYLQFWRRFWGVSFSNTEKAAEFVTPS